MSNVKHLRVLKKSLSILALTVVITMIPLMSKADNAQQTYVPQPYVQQPYGQVNYVPQPYPPQPQAYIPPTYMQPVPQYLPYYVPNYYGQGCYTPTGYAPVYPAVYYGHPDCVYYGRGFFKPSLFHYGININFGGRGCRRHW